jgi:hypothetical protein
MLEFSLAEPLLDRVRAFSKAANAPSQESSAPLYLGPWSKKVYSKKDL